MKQHSHFSKTHGLIAALVILALIVGYAPIVKAANGKSYSHVITNNRDVSVTAGYSTPDSVATIQADQRSYTSYYKTTRTYASTGCCSAGDYAWQHGEKCQHGRTFGRAEDTTWHANSSTTVTLYHSEDTYPIVIKASVSGGTWSTSDGAIATNAGTYILVTSPGTYTYSVRYTTNGGGTGTCSVSYTVS